MGSIIFKVRVMMGEFQNNEILGTMKFCLLYQIICCYISSLKTKQLFHLDRRTVCHIRYFVISDLFIPSFHCIWSLVRGRLGVGFRLVRFIINIIQYKYKSNKNKESASTGLQGQIKANLKDN